MTDDLGNKPAAILALMADKGNASGDKPDLAEIQLWRSGQVDELRAAEIKSHIAADPDVYELWQSLVAADQSLSEDHAGDTETMQPGGSMSLWGRVGQAWKNLQSSGSNWPAYSLVAAMALALVIIFPRGDNFPALEELWYDWPYASIGTGTTRSAGLAYALKESLQAGLRSGLTKRVGDREAWLPVINALPEMPPTCTADSNPESCDTRQELVKELGSLAAENYLVCAALDQEQISSAHPIWAEQRFDWKRLHRKQLALNEPALLGPLSELIEQLAGAEDPAVTCTLVGDLVLLSY